MIVHRNVFGSSVCVFKSPIVWAKILLTGMVMFGWYMFLTGTLFDALSL